MKGRLDEGDEKRWWEDNEGMYWRRYPKRDGGRDLKEDLDEGAHKRYGGKQLREGLDEGAHKKDGGRLWRCALSAGVAGVRERGHFGIYYKSTTCRKPLCGECRDFGSQRTDTESLAELDRVRSCY